MKTREQQTEGMQKIADLVEAIGVCMVTWADEAGNLSGRPMIPLEMDSDGSLWFFLKATPDKLESQGRVNAAFARPDTASFVSVAGRATVLHDQKRIEALWSDLATPWFPEGVNDPLLTLLRIDVDRAEYWDASTARMVRMLALAASAAGTSDIDTGKVLNPQSPAALV